MWPRLISQLVDLLPHLTRLAPMADNYLASKRANDRAQAAALADMTENVRGEITRVADSYSGLYRQLAEQKTQILALQESLDVAQTNSTMQTKQLEWITSDVNTLRIWVKFGTVVLVLMLGVLLALTIQLLHRG